MNKQSQIRCELAFTSASSSLGFFLYTVDRGTREGKNHSKNKESLKCGNNILQVMDERPFSSESSGNSICPQISAAGAAKRHLRGVSSPPPLEDDCSPGQAAVRLWLLILSGCLAALRVRKPQLNQELLLHPELLPSYPDLNSPQVSASWKKKSFMLENS